MTPAEGEGGAVLLVAEVWLWPDVGGAGGPRASAAFREQRRRTLDALEARGATFVVHGHPFAWGGGRDKDGAEMMPDGFEVWRFPDVASARAALAALEAIEEASPFARVRAYLATE